MEPLVEGDGDLHSAELEHQGTRALAHFVSGGAGRLNANAVHLRAHVCEERSEEGSDELVL